MSDTCFQIDISNDQTVIVYRGDESEPASIRRGPRLTLVTVEASDFFVMRRLARLLGTVQCETASGRGDFDVPEISVREDSIRIGQSHGPVKVSR